MENNMEFECVNSNISIKKELNWNPNRIWQLMIFGLILICIVQNTLFTLIILLLWIVSLVILEPFKNKPGIRKRIGLNINKILIEEDNIQVFKNDSLIKKIELESISKISKSNIIKKRFTTYSWISIKYFIRTMELEIIENKKPIFIRCNSYQDFRIIIKIHDIISENIKLTTASS